MTHPVDAILDLFAVSATDVVEALQDAAIKAYKTHGRPVSVNDVRGVLQATDYHGDPRILASAFPRKQWVAVGYTTTNSVKAHARSVRTFIPRTGAF